MKKNVVFKFLLTWVAAVIFVVGWILIVVSEPTEQRKKEAKKP